jgi:hypothetical protein
MKLSLYRATALALLASPLVPQEAWAAVRRPQIKPLKTPRRTITPPPVTALRSIPDAPCYMETRYGFVDLTYMCQPQRVAQVTVVGTQRSGNRITGQVRNDTGQPVRYAVVNYSFSSVQSGPQTGYTFVTPVTLQPGQTGNFEIIVTQPVAVQVTTVDWEAVSPNIAEAF